ncbi:MAG: FAD-dependent oxidoreductase [Ilumatobacteraceae bacterium]
MRVVVVGAGPVGATAAAVLASRGVDVVLVEGAPELPKQLRASTFHPATLDLLHGLDAYDVVPELVERGLVADRFQYRERHGGVVAEFRLADIADATGFPFRLQAEQYKLCELLLERFDADPRVTVHFGREVVAASSAGLTASVTFADGSTLEGDFVFAADGASSKIRKHVGIGFDGMTYPDRYVVLSTPFDFADHLDDLAYVNYISDPDEWLVLLRTTTLWRALFPVRDGESDAEALSDGHAERRLQGVVARPEPYEVVHRTIYEVHQRVAERFRIGRIVLAGDAAHINNPLGGMGMNGGVHDAFLLGHGIASVLDGTIPDRRLDELAEIRRTLALDFVQRHTHANAVTLAAADPAVRRQALDRMAATAADPDAAREYLLQAGMISAVREMYAALEEVRT